MQIELKYMVSNQETGKIVAGFNDPHECWWYCHSQRHAVFRITIEGGGIPGRHEYSYCLDVDHNNAESLKQWAEAIWREARK